MSNILSRVPQVVCEKTGFYNLIKGLSEYINDTAAVLYNLIEKIVPIIGKDYSSDLDINYLRRIVTKCGIKIDYLPTNISEDALKQIYFVAIQGFVAQRLSDGSYQSLYDLLNILFAGANISIDDNYNMSYDVEVNGAALNSETFDVTPYLGFYMKPKITGVTGAFTFITSGTACSMKYINGAESNTSTDYTDFYGALNSMDYVGGAEIIINPTGEPLVYYNTTGKWALELK